MHALGLSARVLPREMISGGEMLLENQWRKQAERLSGGDWNPLALHENWTVNSTEKWMRIRNNGISFTLEMENATAKHHTCRQAPAPEDPKIRNEMARLKTQQQQPA